VRVDALGPIDLVTEQLVKLVTDHGFGTNGAT